MAGKLQTILLRLLLALTLLAGAACSNLQLGYNYGDTFTLYYLDSYLDLSSQQEQRAAAGLKKLLAWHRKHELPDYSRELSTAREQMQGQLTVHQLVRMNEFLRGSLERTALQATPLMAELLLSLSPGQVAYLRGRLEQSNAEFREDYLSGNQAQQSQRRYQQMLEQFEPWFGELDAQQLALVRVANADWPVDDQFWYAERMIRQQEMLTLVEYAVAQQPAHAQLTERLQHYILGFERERQAQRQVRVERSREHVMQLIVALSNRGTAAQKQHAMAHAQSLIDDFTVLLAQR